MDDSRPSSWKLDPLVRHLYGANLAFVSGLHSVLLLCSIIQCVSFLCAVCAVFEALCVCILLVFFNEDLSLDFDSWCGDLYMFF